MAKSILVIAWATTAVLWVLSITRWRRRTTTIARLPAGSAAWFWLRVLGIPETDANRAKVIICVSIVGITLVTVAMLVVIVFGSD